MKYYSSLLMALAVHTLMCVERQQTEHTLYKEVANKVPYKKQKPKPKQRVTHPPVRIVWQKRADYYAKCQAKPITDDPYTTSVIIPCYYKHARHLPSLLRLYEQQTQLPDEVVISLSEVHLVDNAVMQALQQELWAFPVKLIVSNEKKYAGENRNTACDHASGTIFICQDADDIPHSRRVEIITHFFKNYPVDHLFHQWVEVSPGDEASFIPYDNLEDISFTYHRAFRELWRCGKFTNGNVAIGRHVFDAIRWSSAPRDQDTTFNTKVYKQFKQGIAIQATLLGYRMYLSSVSTEHTVDVPDETIVEPSSTREKIYPLQLVTIED